MNFEEWLESDATKEFRGLLTFDRKAKELAKVAWIASREAIEHTLTPDGDVCSAHQTYFEEGGTCAILGCEETRPAGKAKVRC